MEPTFSVVTLVPLQASVNSFKNSQVITRT